MSANEVWKTVPMFDGYEVSNFGNVRSWLPIRNHAKPPIEPRQLKIKIDKDGYKTVVLYNCGIRNPFRVAVLVCACFHGEKPSNKHVVRHLDGSRNNDVVENLLWGTPKDNSHDMLLHGTRIHGEKVSTAKLLEKDVLAIRSSKLSCTMLAKMYPVTISMISKIKRKDNWKHIA